MPSVSISTLLKSISETLSMANVFVYGKKGFQNLISDEALSLNETNCLVFLSEPITSDDNFTQGGAVDVNYKINMIFAQKSNLDWTFEQHEVCVLAMRNLSREFGLRILAATNAEDNSKMFKAITNANRMNVHNMFDVNLTGVLFSFNIQPFDDSSICIS